MIAASSISDAGSAERPRVLLADDHPALLALTTDLLAGECFAGSVGDGCTLLAEAERLHPDVIVLDITMPDLHGIEAARQLKSAECRAKLVFLTVHEDADYVRTALHAGGTVYLVKAFLASDLITTVHEALLEHSFVSPIICLEETYKTSGAQKTQQPNVRKTKMLKPLDFRYALVIEEMDSVRTSIVNVLREQGWLVHGIPRAEQAFNILAHIPYNLVVIDSELLGIAGIDFVRILHNSREWRTIRLVIIASSQSADFATQAAEYGAFLARKSRWKHDLFRILSVYEEELTENTVCDQRV